MRKHLIALLALLLSSASVFAVPAKPVRRTVHLADGTTRELTLRGDEHAHYFQDNKGSVFVQDIDGSYQPVTLEDIQARWESRAQVSTERRQLRAAKRRAKWGGTTNPISGKKTGLVILASFADKSLKYTQQDFNDYFNKVGYNKFQMGGSVHDYFYSQSYGQFDLSFDVVGPVQLSKNLSYYGANDLSGNDKHAAEMVGEAIDLAQQAGTDFSKYDWDGDGEVEQIYIIYAGYSEANYASEETIWPHEWDFDSASEYGDGNGAITLDGVRINTYACSSELTGDSGSQMDGIGSACHEFSHCLGLPDFYSTGDETVFGLDSWSVMNYGCYNGPEDYEGSVPCAYTSYERWFAGWLEPTELSTPCLVSGMKPLTQSPEAYVIYNDAHKDEYYLLENRQLDSWDQYGYGHGMLVIHVDYDEQIWWENTVNNSASHPRCDLIPADNQFMTDSWFGSFATAEDLAGDPYPGTTRNTALTDGSRPAATLYNKNLNGTKYMGKPIEAIDETDGTISFSFMGGDPNKLMAPSAQTAAKVRSNGFTARWTAVSNAASYTLEVTEKVTGGDPSEALLLSEDFSGCNSSAESADITGKLDEKLQTPGWQGYKVFEGVGRVRMGASKYGAYLVTPVLTATSGSVTVRYTDNVYTTDGSVAVTVALTDAAGNEVTSTQVFTTGTAHVVTFDNAPGACCVSFSTDEGKQRFYLEDIQVYDGDFDEASFSAPRRILATPYTVTGITGTSYDVTDTDSTKVYTYRVMAVNGDKQSAWSNAVTVRYDPNDPNRGWSEWEPMADGTCTYMNALFFGNPDEGLTISVRTSDAHPEQAQVLIEDWCYFAPLVIDWNTATNLCTVAETYTGYTDDDYGKVYCSDVVSYLTNVMHEDGATYADYPCTYDPETGIFTLTLCYYDYESPEEYWGLGIEKVLLDGDFKDFTVVATLTDIAEAADHTATLRFTLDIADDATSFAYALLPGRCNQTTIGDAVQSIADGTAQGIVRPAAPLATYTVSGIASGAYTLVAVTFNAQGKAKDYDYFVLDYSSTADWRSLGTCPYTDDVLCTQFEDYDPITYNVEVQENIYTPGIYRLVNPYGLVFPENTAEDVLPGDYPIRIDASDPDHVVIEKQPMGVSWGYGECYIQSMASYLLDWGYGIQGYADDEIYGTLKDGVITFPVESLILFMGDEVLFANPNGAFRLDLTGTAIRPAELSTFSPLPSNFCYDLQGRRVLQPQRGLYIVGGKKVLVK